MPRGAAESNGRPRDPDQCGGFSELIREYGWIGTFIGTHTVLMLIGLPITTALLVVALVFEPSWLNPPSSLLPGFVYTLLTFLIGSAWLIKRRRAPSVGDSLWAIACVLSFLLVGELLPAVD